MWCLSGVRCGWRLLCAWAIANLSNPLVGMPGYSRWRRLLPFRCLFVLACTVRSCAISGASCLLAPGGAQTYSAFYGVQLLVAEPGIGWWAALGDAPVFYGGLVLCQPAEQNTRP